MNGAWKSETCQKRLSSCELTHGCCLLSRGAVRGWAASRKQLWMGVMSDLRHCHRRPHVPSAITYHFAYSLHNSHGYTLVWQDTTIQRADVLTLLTCFMLVYTPECRTHLQVQGKQVRCPEQLVPRDCPQKAASTATADLHRVLSFCHLQTIHTKHCLLTAVHASPSATSALQHAE